MRERAEAEGSRWHWPAHLSFLYSDTDREQQDAGSRKLGDDRAHD